MHGNSGEPDLSDLGALSRHRMPLPDGDPLAGPGAAGLGLFWTFLYLGPGRKVPALRNFVEFHPDGRVDYVKLAERSPGVRGAPWGRERVPVEPGQGYGQWCVLDAPAEARILEQYKSTERVSGHANGAGIDVTHVDAEALAQAHLLSGSGAAISHSARASVPTLDYPIYSDGDILEFEGVQNRLPFGLEQKFNIWIERYESTPKAADQDFNPDLPPQMRRLPFNLPSACSNFRDASFTGTSHGFGSVPHINEQQFVCADGMENAWVRFDKADLQSYDHNLDDVPMLEVDDGRGVLFPVTHMWVDFNFPEAACSFDWFSGRRCVASKKFSLWPLPYALFKRMIDWAVGRLTSGLGKAAPISAV